MVVTRRAPAAPLSPASRTNSSQPLPRASAAKSKLSQTNNYPHEPSSASIDSQSKDNGSNESSRDADDSSKKMKHKAKAKAKKGGKKRRDRASSLADVLFRYLLLFFTIYSLTVCPNDVELKSPVCRGLSEYRRLVLEPYVLPAINTALSHPSIAPHVQRVKPYTDRAVQIAKPIALRTWSEWNARVVPQWEKRVVPQWNKYVVPQWTRYIVPQLHWVTTHIEPYRTAAEQEYEKRLGPHIRTMARSVRRLQQVVQPYIVLAANKTYAGYQTAKPYTIPLFQRVKATLKQLLVLLRVQRRKFVDPHVARIWARMQELSHGSPKINVPAPSPAVEEISPYPATVPSTPSPEPEVVEIVETVTPEPVSEGEQEVEAATVTSLRSSEPTTSTEDVVVETLDSAASILSESADSSMEETSSVLEAAKSSATHISSASYVVPAPTASKDPDDFDIDAFAADLGLDVDHNDSAPGAEEAEQVQEHVETEEEKAERLRIKKEQVAEKRRDIMKRHAQWEDDLERLIKDKKKTLRKTLVALRKAAVAEVKSSDEIKGSIEGLVEEAEKYLKGAEAYFKNLKKDSRKQQDKGALWRKVVDKVDAKFFDRLQETEEVVNGWYGTVVNKEEEEVTKVSDEVRDLADRAQADVGLDYAWLDDVTYQDWQRYHDLLKRKYLTRSDDFTQHVQSVQNGSHPSPPINPVQPALEELESEVKDIITGFETRLRRIKRAGDRAFGVAVPEEEKEDVDEEDSGAPEKPLVSILPVPGQNEPSADEAVLNVIGRGKQEVEEAFARARDFLSKKGTPEDRAKGAEEVASSIAQEVEAEARSDVLMSSAVPPAPREEL
ncbi:hypothetical protein EW146_g7696 [Bondarzewia mesenterica]|uniref:Uncharacterized protein n=1 Tax=Bondarzewia mesenterica TaxID=1095465 RepID=A0A4S4LKN0_9AGAM|nr:hypothetical protein EW146_g7696 [Bondarzewia mesenterica]